MSIKTFYTQLYFGPCLSDKFRDVTTDDAYDEILTQLDYIITRDYVMGMPIEHAIQLSQWANKVATVSGKGAPLTPEVINDIRDYNSNSRVSIFPHPEMDNWIETYDCQELAYYLSEDIETDNLYSSIYVMRLWYHFGCSKINPKFDPICNTLLVRALLLGNQVGADLMQDRLADEIRSLANNTSSLDILFDAKDTLNVFDIIPLRDKLRKELENLVRNIEDVEDADAEDDPIFLNLKQRLTLP